jgi:hypothetical protein
LYNLLLSVAAGVVTWLLFWLLGFSFPAAGVPAMFVFPVVAFFANRRTSQQVAAALAPLQELVNGMQGGVRSLEERDAVVDKMKALLRSVQTEYGQWQFLLHGQIEGQLGMLDYARLKFDEAEPQLAAASTWDWISQAALGCLRFRRDDLKGAWEAFEVSRKAGPKEPLQYAVHAILRDRKGDREEALSVLRVGLEAIPDQPLLKQLRDLIANKAKVSPVELLGQQWYQFFPEELPAPPQQQMYVRGTRGPPPEGAKLQYVMPPPGPKSRGKLSRRR